ncbi:hypothetical protein DICVIV_01682 [Dictyocaulus viviparus]|uniref:Phosphatidylinositol-glycan biosynthesis class S protein n=1 Tax=Dictyocaulus viviparus TaxID=29172 RepID=A0A0D8Y5F0_DICVI|nr:hypothetical protein DICVIV_01682 [Dictyocaulus viviparus]
MSGIVYKMKNLISIGQTKNGESEEIPPKNMTEVIQRLPEAFHKYMDEELPYRHASALAFILIVLGMGAPLWYHTTKTYRAPFVFFPKDQALPLRVQIHLAVTDENLEAQLDTTSYNLSLMLLEGDVKAPLNIKWEILYKGVRDLHFLENERMKPSDTLAVYIAIVPIEQWPHFSAIPVFLGRGHWTFLQYSPELDKLTGRLRSLVWEVMVDVPHINEIVKRDLREKLEPWQIAALSPSHQKRLVWDSVPLSMNYIVQIIHVHDNAYPNLTYSKEIMTVVEVFKRRLENITRIQLSAEHLWDFEISNFFDIDVQGRSTVSQQAAERLLKEIDSQLQSVESSYPVLKIVIIEAEVPVIMLDAFGEDSRGIAVASWGAIIPRIYIGETTRKTETAARVLAALRILLGVDSELPLSWKRDPVPLADWEIERMRIRAVVDNAMRAISAINALKALTEKISNVVINDDVAARANQAVHLVQTGLENPASPHLNLIAAGRFLADEALSHPSLLSLLYFPKDQTLAVYLPIMLPTLIPLFGSIVALCKWILGWS